jgi:U1 small nuclear ribonucleoprotein
LSDILAFAGTTLQEATMTDKLPPPLLALFQPRPPLRYLPPTTRAPEDCKKSTISGVAAYLARAKEEQPAFEEEHPYNATESWIQRKWRQTLEKQERQRAKLEEDLKNCMDHPHPLNLPLCQSCSAYPC